MAGTFCLKAQSFIAFTNNTSCTVNIWAADPPVPGGTLLDPTYNYTLGPAGSGTNTRTLGSGDFPSPHPPTFIYAVVNVCGTCGNPGDGVGVGNPGFSWTPPFNQNGSFSISTATCPSGGGALVNVTSTGWGGTTVTVDNN